MMSSDSASSSRGMTMGLSMSKVLSKKPELMNLIFMKHLHAKNYANDGQSYGWECVLKLKNWWEWALKFKNGWEWALNSKKSGSGL